VPVPDVTNKTGANSPGGLVLAHSVSLSSKISSIGEPAFGLLAGPDARAASAFESFAPLELAASAGINSDFIFSVLGRVRTAG